MTADGALLSRLLKARVLQTTTTTTTTIFLSADNNAIQNNHMNYQIIRSETESQPNWLTVCVQLLSLSLLHASVTHQAV